MRRLIALLFPVVLVFSLCAGSRTYETGNTYRTFGRGGGGGVTITATLSANGDAPVISVRADLGIDIAVAASAALTGRYPWHDNDEAWAVVAEDTSSAEADGRHTITANALAWGAYEGDTLQVHARIYHGAAAIYDTLATLILDAPGVLHTALWRSSIATCTAAVDSGWIPADGSESAAADNVYNDDDATYMRYAYLQGAIPDSVGAMLSSGVYAPRRSRHDAAFAAGTFQPIVWFDMSMIPVRAEIVHARLYFETRGGDIQYMNSGQYLSARLDTVAADTLWLSAAARGADPRHKRATWNSVHAPSSTAWTPPLDSRDDWFDFGPGGHQYGPSELGDGGDVAANHAWYVDVSNPVQQYVDRGAGRINAGWWPHVGINDTGTATTNGGDFSLGGGASCNGEPVQVVQWVTGNGRVLPWGTGWHQIPLVFIADDTYLDQLDWISSWGVENMTLAVNGSWIDGYGGAHATSMTAAQIDSLYDAGADIAMHGRQHTVSLGLMASSDSLYTYGTQRPWIDDILTRASSDTGATELDDWVYHFGSASPYYPYVLMNTIGWLVQNGYRSATSAAGISTAGRSNIGTRTPIYWDGYFNAFNIKRGHSASSFPDADQGVVDADTAWAILAWDIDQSADDGHYPVIYWAHTDSDVADSCVTFISDAADAKGSVVKMTLEEVLTLRLAGQSPVTPSTDWLPAPSGIDSVWTRGHSWIDQCWYPPYGETE